MNFDIDETFFFFLLHYMKDTERKKKQQKNKTIIITQSSVVTTPRSRAFRPKNIFLPEHWFHSIAAQFPSGYCRIECNKNNKIKLNREPVCSILMRFLSKSQF